MLEAGGHWGYSFGTGRIKVETEAVGNLGKGRSQKCLVGGPEEECPRSGRGAFRKLKALVPQASPAPPSSSSLEFLNFPLF